MSTSTQLAYAFDDDDEPEQDFLFLIEEAYTQEKGEWQLSATTSQSRFQLNNNTDGKNQFIGLSVEYGITDRLQVEAELPYQKTTIETHLIDEDESTIGNPEIAVSYKLWQENDNIPAITAGIEVVVASSSEKAPIRSEEWGVETFINASKHINEFGFFHASLGYGIEDEGDSTEMFFGLGYVLPIDESWALQAEYLFEQEKEDDEISGLTEKESLSTLSLGVNYQFENEVILGLAYATGNDEESLDHSINLKIQYEFY